MTDCVCEGDALDPRDAKQGAFYYWILSKGPLARSFILRGVLGARYCTIVLETNDGTRKGNIAGSAPKAKPRVVLE